MKEVEPRVEGTVMVPRGGGGGGHEGICPPPKKKTWPPVFPKNNFKCVKIRPNLTTST